jgi:TRAP transporter 4TM/12TM fusion protein
VPYSAVIKAAAIPAFASYCALFYITHIEACKLGLPRIPRHELPKFGKVLAGGWHFLLPLTVLIYHLIIARHSPELSAFHAIWVMALVWIAERLWRANRANEPLAPAAKAVSREILSALEAGARNMIAVALATAAAGIIVGVVSLGLGGLITQIIEHLSFGSLVMMLVITALASLLVGMGLPTTATYIVMATLIAPAIVLIGGQHGLVVPLIAAHLFCFYFGILADDTPPVGLAAYAAAAIAKSPPIATGVQAFLYDIRTAILPFMFIFNTDLILHGIDNWPQGLLIFAMACAANCAFAAATQGWFAQRNRWPETIALLLSMIPLFRPDLTARLLRIPHDQRYWCYAIGVLIMAGVYLIQCRRDAEA